MVKALSTLIEGRTITNPSFADDIGGLGGEEEELAKLVECLDKASTAYDMEISAKKTKLMMNDASSINREIKVNGQKLEKVKSFKYLGSVVSGEDQFDDEQHQGHLQRDQSKWTEA